MNKLQSFMSDRKRQEEAGWLLELAVMKRIID